MRVITSESEISICKLADYFVLLQVEKGKRANWPDFVCLNNG